MITGDEEPSKGNIIIDKKLRIGYVPQYIEFDKDLTLFDVMLNQYKNLSEKLRTLESAMTTSTEDELKKILNQYQDLSLLSVTTGSCSIESVKRS